MTTDGELEGMVEDLRSRISAWVATRDVGPDWGFHTYEFFRSNDEPRDLPIVLYMWFENGLYPALSSCGEDWDDFNAQVLSHTQFECEAVDHVMLEFFPRVDNPALVEAFRRYYRFRWACSLLRAEFSSVHAEIYEYFGKYSSDLARLEWRSFEKLIASSFENNGFRAVLGPGRADGGVDVRIYQHDAVSENLTLVQAKRHGHTRPVRVDAVRSFMQVVGDEGANRGIFVTTSRFQPAAKRFAACHAWRLLLADSDDVAKWCSAAAEALRVDRLRGKYREARKAFRSDSSKTPRTTLVGRILTGSWGWNCRMNKFALILAETKSGVLAAEVPGKPTTRPVSSIGHERPQPPASMPMQDPRSLRGRQPFWAWKHSRSGGPVSFYGKEQSWWLWDGKPVAYDWND